MQIEGGFAREHIYSFSLRCLYKGYSMPFFYIDPCEPYLCICCLKRHGVIFSQMGGIYISCKCFQCFEFPMISLLQHSDKIYLCYINRGISRLSINDIPMIDKILCSYYMKCVECSYT